MNSKNEVQRLVNVIAPQAEQSEQVLLSLTSVIYKPDDKREKIYAELSCVQLRIILREIARLKAESGSEYEQEEFQEMHQQCYRKNQKRYLSLYPDAKREQLIAYYKLQYQVFEDTQYEHLCEDYAAADKQQFIKALLELNDENIQDIFLVNQAIQSRQDLLSGVTQYQRMNQDLDPKQRAKCEDIIAKLSNSILVEQQEEVQLNQSHINRNTKGPHTTGAVAA